MNGVIEHPGPLGRLPTVEGIVREAYGVLSASPDAKPLETVWMIVRATLQVARDTDKPEAADLVQALAASLGEIIADLPPERQQQTLQVAIHQALAYAEMLRTPGFDQPHGATGHA